jgi:hypothetical protein
MSITLGAIDKRHVDMFWVFARRVNGRRARRRMVPGK